MSDDRPDSCGDNAMLVISTSIVMARWKGDLQNM